MTGKRLPPLSVAVSKEITDAIRRGQTIEQVAASTPYSTAQIKQALRGSPRLYAKYRRERQAEKQKDIDGNDAPVSYTFGKKRPKPRYVRDAEKRLGLGFVFRADHGTYTEWLALSPTGIPLFAVYGVSDIMQGCTAPQPAHIQGLSKEEVRQRRRRKPSMEPKNDRIEKLGELDG